MGKVILAPRAGFVIPLTRAQIHKALGRRRWCGVTQTAHTCCMLNTDKPKCGNRFLVSQYGRKACGGRRHLGILFQISSEESRSFHELSQPHFQSEPSSDTCNAVFLASFIYNSSQIKGFPVQHFKFT